MILNRYDLWKALRRYRNQRLIVDVKIEALGGYYADHHRLVDVTAVKVNGIYVGCWNPVGSMGRKAPLHLVRIELRDVYINDKPLLLDRRRSRDKRKGSLNYMRIALSEIIWPVASAKDSDASGRSLRQGIAGFLATGLPALDTPPEKEKTDRSNDAEGIQRPVGRRELHESRMHRTTAVVQSDPRTVERYRAAVSWFKKLKSKSYGLTDVEVGILKSIRGALEDGIPFRKVMQIVYTSLTGISS